jgi:hypothetical protein
MIIVKGWLAPQERIKKTFPKKDVVGKATTCEKSKGYENESSKISTTLWKIPVVVDRDVVPAAGTEEDPV